MLKQRQKVHGHFSEDAWLSQALKGLIHNSPNWHKMSSVQQEALDMDCSKTARICTGDPNHKDHWDDKAGYATLVSRTL
jgi:hypothetical protein